MNKLHLTWVEIDVQALRNNILQLRRRIGSQVLLTAVVKANAYGHGIAEIASLVLEAGIDWLAVYSLEEALLLRELQLDCPVLLLGYVQRADLPKAVQAQLRLTVFDVETLDELSRLADGLKRDIRLHLKVETGMNRQGVLPEHLSEALDILQRSPYLVLEGVCSHLATAEEPDDPSYARFQIENFQRALKQVEDTGINVPIRHLLNSAGALLLKEARYNMVRVGISMYGLWPSEQTRRAFLKNAIASQNLTPVLTWKTKVVQVKDVSAGSYVSYGRIYRTIRPTRLAVLPVGYSDGYDRKLSNRGHVLIRGRRALVLGRVSMNAIVVDATDIPGVKLEDEAVLLGRQADQEISAEELADLVGTINYEVVTRINRAIPRVVVGQSVSKRSRSPSERKAYSPISAGNTSLTPDSP
jgi:alanine racemase